jgi:hypothetical protein
MSKRKKPKEYELLKLKCRCGRHFFMALSRKVSARFGIGSDPDEAVAKLAEQLYGWRGRKPRIPDFLPPDI